MSLFLSFFFFFGKVVKLVSGGSLINEAYPVYFLLKLGLPELVSKYRSNIRSITLKSFIRFSFSLPQIQ